MLVIFVFVAAKMMMAKDILCHHHHHPQTNNDTKDQKNNTIYSLLQQWLSKIRTQRRNQANNSLVMLCREMLRDNDSNNSGHHGRKW